MGKRKRGNKIQLTFGDLLKEFGVYEIPAHVTVITTRGKRDDRIVREMMAVPLSKGILLDFVIGHQSRSGKRKLSARRAELVRLQRLLNSRHRGKRFGWLEPANVNMIAAMVRKSIAGELWKPKLKEKRT